MKEIACPYLRDLFQNISNNYNAHQHKVKTLDWRYSLIERLDGEVEMLERHVKLIATLKEHQPIGIIRLSELLEMPQHKVRYSLRILEQDGIISPSAEGAVLAKGSEAFAQEMERFLKVLEQRSGSIRRSL